MILKKIKPFSNIVALISSNLFLILAFYFSTNVTPKKILHNNHKLLLLPIEVYVPLNSIGTPVTLYDQLDNIVVKRAQIHKTESEVFQENTNLRLLEVEEKDLIKIINFKGKILRAFPMVEDSIRKEQEIYEFNF
jgi:hypothetical protein